MHLKDVNGEVLGGMRRREFGFIEGLRRRVFRELGTGELDVAGVVAFLCSERARHITGSVIRVDGGQYI